MKRYSFIIAFFLMPIILMAQGVGGEIRRPVRASSNTQSSNVQQRPSVSNTRANTTRSTISSSSSSSSSQPIEINYDTYNSALVQRAQSGDAVAQYALAICYYNGTGISPDHGKAIEWLTKSANNGNSDAQYVLGYFYFEGDSVNQDYEEAYHWVSLAAVDNGNVDAMFLKGICYMYGYGISQSDIWAAVWFEKAAQEGHAISQLYIANCYYTGTGVTSDFEKAVEWLRKAANQDVAEAQYALGTCFEGGHGVQKDYGLAFFWYNKSAEQDFAIAQYALGLCYENGIGTIANQAKAIEWYKKAADQGVEEAKDRIEEINNSIKSNTQDNISQNLSSQSQKNDVNQSLIIQNLINNMILVEGGTFSMGATPEQEAEAWQEEAPSHKVTLASFYIGKYEVTQAEWEAVMGYNPSYFKGDNLPVENVSWDDCQVFITKLNEITGNHYRLPTEEEWEYAARGGKKGRSHNYKYSGDDTPYTVACFLDNSGGRTEYVGIKESNQLGLFDMSGNVYEWCANNYATSYSKKRASITSNFTIREDVGI